MFDRWVQAYTCGLARAPSRAAVANTTGVSSTTVASRLSTAVITEASTKTATSSRRGRPAAVRAIHAPQARNSPSSSHSWASTSTAARKPITGPSRSASARGLVQRDRTGADHHGGGRDRDHRLRPAPRPYHRPGQHRHEQDDGQGFRERVFRTRPSSEATGSTLHRTRSPRPQTSHAPRAAKVRADRAARRRIRTAGAGQGQVAATC